VCSERPRTNVLIILAQHRRVLALIICLFTISAPELSWAQFASNSTLPVQRESEAQQQHRGLAGFLSHIFSRSGPRAQSQAPNTQLASRDTSPVMQQRAAIGLRPLGPKNDDAAHNTKLGDASHKDKLYADLDMGKDEAGWECDPRFISEAEFYTKCLGPFADPALARKILTDKSLRRGDAVMTPQGLFVYTGTSGTYHLANQFSPLNKTNILDQKLRDSLTQIDMFAQLNNRYSLDVVGKLP
jgi:hypothetical protein